jgi:GNAT superfamily N-acetyltransferase
MGIQICIENDLPAAERRQIIRELVAFNDRHAASENDRDLIVVLRAEGSLIGGLIGFTYWNWLFVKQLWVSEAFRSQGHGSELMLAAEREAAGRGCGHAHLDTFDFQALPFYRKLGYVVFGELEDFPPGHTRYFLQKRNLATTGPA